MKNLKKCSRCGRYIKNQYIVGGKIYGSVCVEKFNKPLNSIGVTGTNGKTSVVWNITQIYF